MTKKYFRSVQYPEQLERHKLDLSHPESLISKNQVTTNAGEDMG